MGTVTIVPATMDEKSGLTLTRGTRVLVDGQELKGVIRVVLVAEVNDVWRAHIECHAQVPVMPGMYMVVEDRPPLTWWRRLLLRIAGVSMDATDLGSSSHTYRRP
jgi:hypothetical protein